MRLFIITLFMLSISTLSYGNDGIGGQYPKELEMLSGNPKWEYASLYKGTTQDTYLTNMIDDERMGFLEVNEKCYHKLYRIDLLYIDAGPWGPLEMLTDPIGIREEGGRVYAECESYKSMVEVMRQRRDVEGEIPFLLTPEGEYLLYDFTLQVGDKYPASPAVGDLFVTGKATVTDNSGQKRSMLTLSNGVQILEGVGCMNSNGLLTLYLFTSGGLWTNTEDYCSRLHRYEKNGTEVYPFANSSQYSLSGTVCNQDGKPVAGAKIGIVDLNTFYKYEQDMFDILEVRGDTVYICTTDDEGRYDATFNLWKGYYDPSWFWALAWADGYPVCRMNGDGFPADETDTLDFTLCNKPTYHLGEEATIILPTKPDPALGQYFRLAGVEQCGMEPPYPRYRVVFEPEPDPQANTPYIIIPSRDFQLDLSEMDLTIEPGRVTISTDAFHGWYYNETYAVVFAGTYQSFLAYDLHENYYIHSLDNDSYYRYSARVEACHAYLGQPWDFRRPVLRGEQQAINSSVPASGQSASVSIFDLQGRRLAAPPAKGVYIRDGRKVVR